MKLLAGVRSHTAVYEQHSFLPLVTCMHAVYFPNDENNVEQLMYSVIKITSTAQCVLNLLRRTMHGCQRDAKIRAYTALVCPHLECCAPKWTPHQQKLLDNIENEEGALCSEPLHGTRPARLID